MGFQNEEYPFEVMFFSQVNDRFDRWSCFFDCCSFTMFVYVLFFTFIFNFFVVSVQLHLSSQGRRGQVFDGSFARGGVGGNLYTFDRMQGSLYECDQLGRTRCK